MQQLLSLQQNLSCYDFKPKCYVKLYIVRRIHTKTIKTVALCYSSNLFNCSLTSAQPYQFYKRTWHVLQFLELGPFNSQSIVDGDCDTDAQLHGNRSDLQR